MSDQQQRDLAALDNARWALAQAENLDQVKTFRDKFETLRLYARSVAMGLEAQNRAAEMKLRAERKAGELLAAMRLHGGDRRSRLRRASASSKLKQSGITHGQSHRWQLEASVPEDQFEQYLSATRQLGKEVSSTAFLRLARQLAVQRREAETARLFPGGEIVQRLEDLVAQGLTFGCIHVDPPWPSAGRRRLKLKKAASSTVRQLLSMPVRRLAKPRAHVHLWTTDEHLFDARRVLSAWGFAHRSSLVWVRALASFGPYWRPAHEYLLLGVRGQLAFRDNGLMSWIQADPPRDGRKPEEIRRLLECASPGPYLELYGQRPRPGWTVLYGEESGDRRSQTRQAAPIGLPHILEVRMAPTTLAHEPVTMCS